MGKFNLVEEPWISVKMLDGRVKEMGLREVLIDSQNILAIENTSPLIVASTYRLLLSIIYRALKGPCSIRDAISLYKEGLASKTTIIGNYLDQWAYRFNLIDEKFPFFQVADYEPQSYRFWTAMASELNDDNSKVLFDHTNLMSLKPIEYKEAARWLLATQTFSIGKGKSEFQYTKGAPSASSIIFVIQGKNLADSLLLMLYPYTSPEMQANDVPVWERDPLSASVLKAGPKRDIQGYADLYTWMARSIRLFEESEGTILNIGLASGIDYENPLGIEDPMLAFRTDEKKGRRSLQFGERGLWRSFDSILPTGSSDSTLGIIENAATLHMDCDVRFAFSLNAMGQRNDKAKIEYWRWEKFTMPYEVITDKAARGFVNSCIRLAEDIGQSMNSACRFYARKMLSPGEREADKKDVSSFVRSTTALPDYWSLSENEFNRLLAQIAPDSNFDELGDRWRKSMTGAAWQSWNKFMESQIGARSIIARVHAERTLATLMKKAIGSLEGGAVFDRSH